MASEQVIPDVVPASECAHIASEVLRAGAEILKPMIEHRQAQDSGRRAETKDGANDLLRDAIAAHGFEATPTGTDRTVAEHNALLDQIARELRDQNGLTDIYNDGVPTGSHDPGVNHIAYYPELAPYLADPRVLGVAKAMLDPHVRIAQLEINKTNGPAPKEGLSEGWMQRRGYHSDWPHDITHVAGGHVAQPFPDVCMALSTVWYLVDVGPENGSTWVVRSSGNLHQIHQATTVCLGLCCDIHYPEQVPGSHTDPRNPRGADDTIDGGGPIPGEMQVRATAGSVFMQDSRCWHSTATNPSDAPRTSLVARYCPWWLSTEFSRGQFGFGGCNNARVPREIYDSMPFEAQLLFRHNVEGVPDGIVIEKHLASMRNGSSDKRSLDQPNEALLDYEALGAEALGELAGGDQPLAWKRETSAKM